MVQFDDVDEGPCPFEMKESGNAAFQKGELKEAVESWEIGVERIEQLLPLPPTATTARPQASDYRERYCVGKASNETHKRLLELRVSLLSNLSLALLKLQKYDRTVDICNQVLLQEPEHVKALYRKAEGHKAIGRTTSKKFAAPSRGDRDGAIVLDEDVGLTDLEVAARCLEKVLRLDPGNKAAHSMLQDISKLNRKGKKWLSAMSGYGQAAQAETDELKHRMERETQQHENMLREGERGGDSQSTTNGETSVLSKENGDTMNAAGRGDVTISKSGLAGIDVDMLMHSGDVSIKKIVEVLGSRGAVVIKCGTDSNTLGRAVSECTELYEDNKLTKPPSSKDKTPNFMNPHFRIRDDHTAFMSQTISKDPRCPNVRDLGNLLTKFGSSLGKAVSKSLNMPIEAFSDLELCYYPGNKSRHTLHLDNPAGSMETRQKLTCIYFITPQDWNAETDGGYLRLTIPSVLSAPPKTVEQALEIEEEFKVPPLGDTLVVLRSDAIWWDLSFVNRSSLACFIFYLMSPKTDDQQAKAYDDLK
eukprot:GHVS01069192.1.p1 GENE.GHVS01069192.1~~GHVS01069192.1.p1  ORF type:complete len:533 (-),score=61.98 GHVS01069192.1:1720-3318(-)